MRAFCPRLARPYPALLLTLGALACYFIVSEHSRTKSTWHYLIKSKESQVVSAPKEKRSEFSRITFLETGGHGKITARMACAVESAARLHPDWTVYLLSAAHGEETSKDNATSSFAKLLGSIPNVVMGTIKPQEVLQGTPLEPWYESGILIKSAFPVEHLADALRLAVVYKQGGVYLDIDVIVMRPFDSLPPCVCQAPVNDGDMVGNAFFAFHRGNPFVLDLMERARKVYKPRHWSSIGPLLLRQATLAWCKAKTVKRILSHRCGGVDGFTVMPHWIFMPISSTDWRLHFTANASRQVWIMTVGSYAIHFYNALSWKAHAVPGCFYREAAELYCPDSLHLSLDINGVF